MRRSRRRRLIIGINLFFIMVPVLLGVYAFCLEPGWLQVNHYEVYMLGLPASLDGFTIVQLSDLHY